MKIATTTGIISAFLSERSIAAPLEYFADTKYRHLDLSFYNIIYPGSPWIASGDGWLREVEAVWNAAEKYGFSFVQAHSPDGEHYADGEKRNALLLATERSIIACGMLGIPHTVIHAAGYAPDNSLFVQKNIEFYRLFADTSEKYSVDMLTENSSAKWAPTYLLRTGRDMADFVAEAGIPRLHICWDTGHANCEGLNQYDEIIAMGSELKALHMQDNFGDTDLHITPIMGTTNFDRVMQGLCDTGYKGNFTFEDDCTIRRNFSWPIPRKFVMPDDKLSNIPLPIVQRMVDLSYDIGKWMAESYGFEIN